MGRRPNAVVAEFFERGAKLEDSSNRYKHTCRKCGQLFPKGRVDALVTHVIRKCPSMTPTERNAVAAATQQQGSQPADQNDIDGISFDMAQQNALSQPVSIPVSLERQQSALDTLAEVSRRHLDYSSQRDAAFDSAQNNLVHDANQALAEQALWAQLRHSIDLPITQETQHDVFDMTNHHRDLETAQLHSDSARTTFDASHPSLVQTSGPGDSTAASHGLHHLTSLDPQLDAEQHNNYHSQQRNDDNRDEETGNISIQESHIAVAIPQTEVSSDFISWTPHAPTFQPVNNANTIGHTDQDIQLRAKPRARFSDARRKEVSETRKRGACLRCRMLKKPCSDGTPCSTCAKVDAARLWKAHCIRTKLHSEFTAWDCGLYTSLYQSQAHELITACHLDFHEVDIDINSQNERIPPITLTGRAHARRGTREGVSNLTIAEMLDRDTANEIFFLNQHEAFSQNLIESLTSSTTITAAVQAEDSALLRNTLIQAQELHDSQEASLRTLNTTRAAYSLTNMLLKNVLELWVLTVFLTSGYSTTSAGPVLDLTFNAFDRRTGLHQSIEPGSISHHMMSLQILQTIEAQVIKLAKMTINELERHLLQRQQVSGFSTFISAVVLLFSVERTIDFFQTMRLRNDSTSSIMDNASLEATVEQARSFAYLVTMLLHMRGLPPRTSEDEHGMLIVVDQPDKGVTKVNGSASAMQVRALDAERRIALTAWIGKCQISCSELRSLVDAGNGNCKGTNLARILLGV